MEPSDWIETAKKDRTVLTELIRDHHPRSVRGHHQPFLDGVPVGSKRNREQPLPITAPDAEAACELVRSRIRTEDADMPDPVHMFETAIDTGDWRVAYSIISETWFGVPESTSAWSISGFGKACGLLDDPPEDDGEAEGEEGYLLDEITEGGLSYERGYGGDL